METFSWQGRDEEGNKVIYEASHFGGWWQLTCSGEAAQTGADTVVLEDGGHYGWVYTVS